MNKHPPRGQSRNTSRNTSREPSPSKMVISPTRAPAKNFRNVQAKVNSFNKPKPKVPPKPEVLNTNANETKSNSVSKIAEENKYKTTQKSQLLRKDSENKIYSNTPRTSTTTKNSKNSNQSVNSSSNSLNKTANNNTQNQNSVKSATEVNGNSPEKTKRKSEEESAHTSMSTQNKPIYDNNGNENSMKKSESSNKLNDVAQASSTVVSSTTNTAAQPLKIDAKLEEHVKNTGERMAPIVDGRILSATSVSNAMNKMNDSVLSTNTVMKEHNHSKLSPAASAIISLSNPQTNDSQSYSTKESVEAVLNYKPENYDSAKKEQTTAPNSVKNSSNTEVNKVGHTANNVHKFAVDHTPHADVNTMQRQRSINDKILDARTVVAADVKPLKITVREKPVNAEVQSGNVRINNITANGVSEIHG